MRLLRSAAFNLIMFGSGAALSLYGLAVALVAPGRIMDVARLWARICLWGLRVCNGITLNVTGREHLPAGGAVIAAQHQSALDILAWLALLPHPAFVFKQELKRIPFFGQLLEPAGMIPVNRGGGAPALRAMVDGAMAAVQAGRQVIIFPEGTRVAHGARGRLRQGIAVLAEAVDVPILPATTDSGRRWGRKSFGKHPGPVRIDIHAPLPQGLPREAVLTHLAALYYGPGD